jgi:hypothetical protein
LNINNLIIDNTVNNCSPVKHEISKIIKKRRDSKNFIQIHDIIPMFYNDTIALGKKSASDRILVIGINPSISKQEIDLINNKGLSKSFKWSYFKKQTKYDKKNIISKAVVFQENLIYPKKTQYSYFKKLNEIILNRLDIEDKYDFYDIFSLRFSKQSILLEALKSQKCQDYYKESIKMLNKVISKKYKAVISTNAKASEIVYNILKKRNFEIEDNKSFNRNYYGYFKIKENNTSTEFYLFKQLNGRHIHTPNYKRELRKFNLLFKSYFKK